LINKGKERKRYYPIFSTYVTSSTDFPVISDGNFGVEVATTVEVEVVL